MQERNQAFERLAKAHAEAEKISNNLKALTKGSIKVDSVTIPQTNTAWTRNNLLAAQKIDAISNNIAVLDPKKLTTSDLNKLADGLENIAENFRYNTPENRNAAKIPNHAYDSKNYFESLQNSSVSNSFLGRIDYIAVEYIDPIQEKFSIIEHEDEYEISFRDLEAQTPTEKAVSKIQNFDLEPVINAVTEVVPIMPFYKRNEQENRLTFTTYNNPRFDYITGALEKCQEQYGFTVEKKQSSENLATLEVTLSKPIDEESFKRDFAKAYYALDKDYAETHQELIEIKKEKEATTKASLKATLDDAEATADAALWGMFGSGGVLGSAVVVGAVLFGLGVALGPIGWGILGGVALLGLGGLVASAVMGNAAEEKADAIEAQMEEMSPDGGGYPNVERKYENVQTQKPTVPSDKSSNAPTPVATPEQTYETPKIK